VEAALAGNFQKATDLHNRLHDLFDVLFCETNPIPVKAALIMKGWDVGSVRSPLVPAGESVQQELKRILQDLA
jgi:4-hydroxy-tetrahydrodipicolinate synthase